MNSCEKRDSADAVVVRNAIDLSSCNLSGLSAGAILNCGYAPNFQHVHLPESAENSQLRILPAPDYVTGSFRRPGRNLRSDSFRLTEQTGKQWNQSRADQCHAAASHQLFYVFYEKIFARNEP